MNSSPAPIALFVFNRPWHTRQTVESLQQNELAHQSDLFVFSDGPKTESDRNKVQEVREYIRTLRGFKNISLIEQKTNKGLAQSIISGVTSIVNKYGKIIVLEDDLISSPYFLIYMNNALDRYQNEPRVMHISGSAYPINKITQDDTYFLRIPLCWGWGTWKRAWDLFDKDQELMKRFDRRMISRFNFEGTYPYWKQLELNRSGQINTWFVFWYATVFLNDALALFPKKALIKNIGHDGTGVHCGKSGDYDVDLSPVPIRVLPIPLEESREALNWHIKYFRSIYQPVYIRIFRKIASLAKK